MSTTKTISEFITELSIKVEESVMKSDLRTRKGLLQAIYNFLSPSIEDVGLGDIQCINFYYYNTPMSFSVENGCLENTRFEIGELRALYRDIEKVKYFIVHYLNGGERLFELKPF